MRGFVVIFLMIAFAVAPTTGRAQTEEKPLEITADQTLEWRRVEKKYIARGNAMARQGEVTITAQTLTAEYRETEDSGTDIYQITAEGDVRITSGGNSAQGDRAVYTVETGLAVMTGGDLRLISADQTVSARDSIEYLAPEGRLTAKGDALVTRAGDTLRADTVSAWFSQDAQKQRRLDRMEAAGGVVITTPNEKIAGARAIYTAATDLAEMTGGVKIERGPNILEGDRADVNLATNVSRLHGGTATGGGRVRGVFYPGSEKQQGSQEQTP